MTPLRRALLALAAVSAAPAARAAADDNGRPLRLVVNFPAGGAADVIARAVAGPLAEALKQPVIVDNRPGANGNLGAEAVARAPADGQTLLLSSGAAMTVNPFLYPRMAFDPTQDLVPVASAARVHVYLVVHPAVPAADAAAFFAHLKSNPGRLSYGSAGNGSMPHLAGEMLKTQLGVFAVHVPYRGAAPALADLLSGQVQFMFDPGTSLRLAREGRLRVLAVGSPRRSSAVPEVPTLDELGLKGFDADTVFGFHAPAATPPARLERLHAEITRVLQSAPVQQAIKGLGAEPLLGTRAEFSARQAADRLRFGKFIRDNGIRAD